MSTGAFTIQESLRLPIQGVFTLGGFPLPVRPPSDQAAFTKREQPNYLVAQTRISLAGPTVRPPTDQKTITVREQPFHPLPGWDRGVAPKSVRPPTDQKTITVREQPPHYQARWAVGPIGNARIPVTDRAYQPDTRPAPVGVAFVRASLPGGPVRTYVTDTVLQSREQPFHPGPRVSAGPYGYNSHPAIIDIVILRQAIPDHLQPFTRISVQGPDIRLLNDRILVGRFQPDHPLPRLGAGVQGPDIRPLNDRILIRQQQPDHPGPRLFGPPPLIPPASQVSARVFVAQVQPDHPGPNYQSGVPGPDTRVVNDIIRVVQQLPDHPRPRTTSGVSGPDVALRVSDRVWLGPVNPDFVRPLTWTGIVTIRVPERASNDRIMLRQLPVPAGVGTVDSGVLSALHPIPAGVAIAAPFAPPAPPLLITLAGLPGGAVGVPQGLLHVPPLPAPQPLPPSVMGGEFGPDVLPPVFQVILIQEQPGTPSLSLTAGLAGPEVIAPLLGVWSFQQQYPTDHPNPSVTAGPYNIILRRLQLIFDWMGSAGVVDDKLEPS